MTDESLGTAAPERGRAGPGGRGRALLAVVLAVLAAAAVGFGAWSAREGLEPWLLVAGAVLAFVGLAFLLYWAAGLIRFGKEGRDRGFADAFADALGDACVVTDGRGRPVFANGPFMKLAGESGAGRLVGIENIYAGYPDAAEHVYRLAQAAREGKAASEEFRLAAGSGAAGAKPDAPAWIRLSVAPVATGKDLTLWRQRDVSNDRARQEQAFAQLQSIISYLDHAPAGFFSADASGKVGYVNATLAEWLGIDLNESAGGSLELKDFVPPNSLALLNGIAPAPGGRRVESFDMELMARDGRAVPVRIVHRADYDSAGNMQPARSLVLARATAADVESGADLRLARFFNHAPIGIAEVSADGTIRNANLAFLALSSRAQRGAQLGAMVGVDQRPVIDAALRAAREREGAAHQADVTLQGETPRSVQLVISRLGGGDDGFIVYGLDSTEKKTLEQQLAQSHKMQAIGQLAGGMAHDFNNVLTAIIGFSDLLLTRHRSSDPAFGDIMSIKQNANRAANLVRQLLAFSRRQTLQPKVLLLTDVLSDLGNLLGRLLGERVELKVVHGRDLGLVLADLNQFEQVIINLAVNARDAMPKGGTLTIRTANVSEEESRSLNPGVMPPGDYVLCEVADTGTGMSKDVVEKIYEPFFSTKEVGKGTGLGLSTVYGIVKQTEGFIFCDSEPGKGTVFRIYLPRHYPQPASATEVKEEKKEVKRADMTGKGRILLVEDEDAVRAFASRALASRGYTVFEASSGERALEVSEEQGGNFDLVVSDVVMPEMDGPTLLKELRKRGTSAKFILMSGYAEDAFQKSAEGAEQFAFLAKPFSLKQLVETAKEVMES